ncbi:jerky protein homolog-like [Anastrepha ludens]|uniref:jerky protein homolog-like n=1 Tax=Anastrepha ludens TaxID=28586 RepID=UPI0023B00D88|nr:jerky protein homolog-like [Anastrepha ludens]
MAKKRAHKTLSLADKLKIIEEVNRGQSGKVLAKKFGEGASTICDIKRNTENIKRFAENSDAKLLNQRKTLKSGENEELEIKLYAWFEEKRSRHQTISAEILRQKAKSLHQKMYPNQSFHASDGWLQNFKKRFSVRTLKICGESLSARSDLVPDLQNKLYDIIETENLIVDQIYNADESGLFWKMFPKKSLVHCKEKSAPGTKMSKERITFLCCANKSGTHKLNIAVVKDHQIENTLPKKALLLLDNAKCHGEPLVSECGQYKTMFLPPNCTSIIQPMDQNAIRLTKLFYKKDLLCELRWASDDNIPLSLLQQELPENDRVEETDEFRTITNLFHRNNDVHISEDEVLSWIMNSDNTSCSSSESDTENEPLITKHVKNREALQALNISIDWAKERGLQSDYILMLKELRNKALEACALKDKQTYITNYLR